MTDPILLRSTTFIFFLLPLIQPLPYYAKYTCDDSCLHKYNSNPICCYTVHCDPTCLTSYFGYGHAYTAHIQLADTSALCCQQSERSSLKRTDLIQSSLKTADVARLEVEIKPLKKKNDYRTTKKKSLFGNSRREKHRCSCAGAHCRRFKKGPSCRLCCRGHYKRRTPNVLRKGWLG